VKKTTAQSFIKRLRCLHCGGRFAVLNFPQSRDKSSAANFSHSAPGAQASLAGSREASAAPLYAGAPGAFCHGIVKNQQRSATES
jgi:hypothetical protein